MHSLPHLIHPVGVQDSEPSQFSASPLFSHTLEVALGLQLCDTLVDWLSVDDALQALKSDEASSSVCITLPYETAGCLVS